MPRCGLAHAESPSWEFSTSHTDDLGEVWELNPRETRAQGATLPSCPAPKPATSPSGVVFTCTHCPLQEEGSRVHGSSQPPLTTKWKSSEIRTGRHRGYMQAPQPGGALGSVVLGRSIPGCLASARTCGALAPSPGQVAVTAGAHSPVNRGLSHTSHTTCHPRLSHRTVSILGTSPSTQHTVSPSS